MSRPMRIAVGYLAASYAAGFVVYCGALGLNVASGFAHALGLALAGAILFGIYVALLALLPGAVGIAFSERYAIRSFIFYTVGGALAGTVAYGLYALLLVVSAGTTKGFFGGKPLTAITTLVGVLAVPGTIAGLVYWLVAGRRAGQS